MINSFLSGKKKYSIPVLAAVVFFGYSLTGQDPPPEIQQWIVASLGGMYLLVEGARDIIREWAGARLKSPVATDKAPENKNTGDYTTPPQNQQVFSPEPPAAPPPPPFDMDALMKQVDPDGKLNAVNTFYEYRHEGMKTKCRYLEHAMTYADKYVELVQKAVVEAAGFPIQEAEQHLSDGRGVCPYVSVDSMARQEGWIGLLEDYRHALRMHTDMQYLLDYGKDIDWKYQLGHGATLYYLAERAGILLGSLYGDQANMQSISSG